MPFLPPTNSVKALKATITSSCQYPTYMNISHLLLTEKNNIPTDFSTLLWGHL